MVDKYPRELERAAWDFSERCCRAANIFPGWLPKGEKLGTWLQYFFIARYNGHCGTFFYLT
jgi:hypothetical protein